MLSADVTWTLDRATGKVTRAEAAPITPSSAELARIYAALQITKP